MRNISITVKWMNIRNRKQKHTQTQIERERSPKTKEVELNFLFSVLKNENGDSCEYHRLTSSLHRLSPYHHLLQRLMLYTTTINISFYSCLYLKFCGKAKFETLKVFLWSDLGCIFFFLIEKTVPLFLHSVFSLFAKKRELV